MSLIEDLKTNENLPSNSGDGSLAALTPDCCEVWPKIMGIFSWYEVGATPERLLMPNIKAFSVDDGTTSFRVNRCPSCGAMVHNVMVSREAIEESRSNLVR